MKNVLNRIPIKQLILGIVTVCTIYVTFGLSTISYKDEIYLVGHIIGSAVSGILYLIFDKISCADISRYENDISIFNKMLFYVTFLFLCGGIYEYIVEETELYKLISKTIYFSIFFIIHLRNTKKTFDISLLKKNWKLIVLLIITTVLMYEPTMFSARWDSKLYYGDFGNANIYSISQMGFFGHPAQGAGVVEAFCNTVLLGNVNAGILVANMLSMIMGIIAFYGAIKIIIKDEREYVYILLTAGYAFLPCVLGLSSSISVDVFIINWFMILVYLYVSEKFFLFSAMGFFYVFTKEPALIIYGGLCIGIFAVDFIKNKWTVFRHTRYYGMLMVAAIWGITVLINGIWSIPGNGTKLDMNFAWGEIKFLFIYNFNWVVWAINIILGIVIIVKQKRISNRSKIVYIIPVLVSILLFAGFSIIFVTSRNPRYIDNITVGGYFVFAVLLLLLVDMGYRSIGIGITVVLSSIFLVSSFKTIDPISIRIFPNAMLGDKYFLSANESFSLGDTSVYNKQFQFLEGAYALAVNEAISNGYPILLDGNDFSVYGIDGMNDHLELTDGYKKYTLLFDLHNKCRSLLNYEDTVEYTTIAVANSDAINELSQIGTCMYIYLDGYDGEMKEYIINNYENTEQIDFSYRGVTLNGIIFEEKKNEN